MKTYIKKFLIVGGICMIISSLNGCFKNYSINNITRLYFHYTNGYAMYADVEYELVIENNVYTATIKQDGVSKEDADSFIVDKFFVQELNKLLTTYHIEKWYNYKKSNKNVLDGDSFELYLTNEKGEHLSASGYEKWPKNYNEIKEGLDTLFMSLYTIEEPSN